MIAEDKTPVQHEVPGPQERSTPSTAQTYRSLRLLVLLLHHQIHSHDHNPPNSLLMSELTWTCRPSHFPINLHKKLQLEPSTTGCKPTLRSATIPPYKSVNPNIGHSIPVSPRFRPTQYTTKFQLKGTPPLLSTPRGPQQIPRFIQPMKAGPNYSTALLKADNPRGLRRPQ